MDRARWITSVLVVVLTAWIYLPLRTAGVVYEDDAALATEPTWTIPSRSLTAWTYQAVGADTATQHAVNVALHLMTGIALAGLVAALATPSAGVLAMAVCLVHPLNSEAVSYLTARADQLVALCAVVAVWAVVAWSDRGGLWRLLIAALALTGAALSKEIGLIAVPLVCWTLMALRRSVRLAAGMNALLCGLGGVVLGATGWRLFGWLSASAGQGGTGFDLPTFLVLQLTAVWHLLTLVVWPAGFSIDHDIVGLTAAWRVAAVLGTCVTAAVAVWAWRRSPLVAWAIGWSAIAVAPRFVFATNEFLHEYHLYPAMAGVSAIIGVGLARWCAAPTVIAEDELLGVSV